MASALCFQPEILHQLDPSSIPAGLGLRHHRQISGEHKAEDRCEAAAGRIQPPYRSAPVEQVGRGSVVEDCAAPGDAVRSSAGCDDRDALCRLRSRNAAVEACFSGRAGERALASAPVRAPRSLTPKFSRMRRQRNSPSRRNLAPHVGCNATLGEVTAQQRVTRCVRGRRRFSSQDAAPRCTSRSEVGGFARPGAPWCSAACRLSRRRRIWCSRRTVRREDAERRLSAESEGGVPRL
jgi:hypothetical protein